MLVWADTGVAERIRNNERIKAAIRLFILERHMIPNFKLAQSAGMDLQDVPGWLVGRISWTPAAGQYAVHYRKLGIDPDHRQVHVDK